MYLYLVYQKYCFTRILKCDVFSVVNFVLYLSLVDVEGVAGWFTLIIVETLAEKVHIQPFLEGFILPFSNHEEDKISRLT